MWSLPICRVQDLALSDASRISNTTLQWTESGLGCIAAADAVGGLAVREAGGVGLQHLHGQPSGK